MSVRAGAVAAAGDRAPVGGADFAALLPDVARRLLGDPPRIGADEWRYRTRGSLAVHPARGTWHDFEAGALAWLVDARLIDPPAGPGACPAARRRSGADR